MTDYSGKRIVTTGPIGPEAISILEQVAPVETASGSDEKTIIKLMGNTIGIVSRGLEAKVTEAVIEAAADLRVIGRPGAGYDTVDLEAAEQGIRQAVEKAERAGKGAISLDHKVIDAPVVKRARKLLKLARSRRKGV